MDSDQPLRSCSETIPFMMRLAEVNSNPPEINITLPTPDGTTGQTWD